VKRRFRLTRSTDFKRVRRLGKSYAHPLIVLIALPNELETSRFAVAAGRSVGEAVGRNQAKRRLREALRPFLPAIASGWDVILLGRRPISTASFHEIQQALQALMQRARILKEPHDD
jgi:ribonuclease P protein component